MRFIAGKGKSKAASQISTYSMSRRVTRRQANLLQSMSGVQDKIDIELPIMEDPVELLDKPEFKGVLCVNPFFVFVFVRNNIDCIRDKNCCICCVFR